MKIVDRGVRIPVEEVPPGGIFKLDETYFLKTDHAAPHGVNLNHGSVVPMDPYTLVYHRPHAELILE